jgi:hypothetical protein
MEKRKREHSPGPGSKRRKVETNQSVTHPDEESEDIGILDDWQEAWLPDEILFLILYRLSRPDLLSCKMCCKQWFRVGLNEALSWITLEYEYSESTGAQASQFEAVQKMVEEKTWSEVEFVVEPDASRLVRKRLCSL